MTYRYADCGLGYVYLVNGYTAYDTEHGSGVSIEDAHGLHEVIARAIVKTLELLGRHEIRFLDSVRRARVPSAGDEPLVGCP